VDHFISDGSLTINEDVNFNKYITFLQRCLHLDIMSSSEPHPQHVVSHQTVKGQVSRLKSLISTLPQSVKQASGDGRIPTVFRNIAGPKEIEEHWVVFNRRMDALFGEDQRNVDGRLSNFHRGEFGMDLVISYIEEAVNAGHLLWEATAPKLDRLIAECEHFG
jgi:hypothetical protein